MLLCEQLSMVAWSSQVTQGHGMALGMRTAQRGAPQWLLVVDRQAPPCHLHLDDF